MFHVLRILLLAVAAHGFGMFLPPDTFTPTEPELPTTTDGVDDDPTRAPAAIPNPALPTARPTDAPQKTDALTLSDAPTKGVASAPTRSPTSTPCQLAITGVLNSSGQSNEPVRELRAPHGGGTRVTRGCV